MIESAPRCPVCKVETLPAHLGGLRVSLAKLGSRRRVAAEPRVCPQCGRVEFFVVNPRLFDGQGKDK